MNFIAKEGRNVLAGLGVACVVGAFDVIGADADTSAHDVIIVNDVSDSEVVTVNNTEEQSQVKIDCFDLSFKEYDVNVEDVVLDRMAVPDGEGICNSLNKTYMAYTKVTSVNSSQYKLLNSKECYTDELSGIRMVGDRYCVAMGTGYALTIGTKINIIMEDGSTVKCILGDVKADENTDDTNRYHNEDGSVVEFIIDESVFKSTSQYPDVVKQRVVRVDIVE